MKETKPVEVANETSKSTTKWDVFEKSGLRPIKIKCDGGFQRVDVSCHTTLPLDPNNMLNHMDEHGGGFRVTLEKSEGKPWSGWKLFKDLGIEAFGLQCDICSANLPLNAVILQKHLFKPHSGDTKRSRANATLRLTLSKEAPLKDDETDFLE